MQVHKSGVGNKIGPHTLILILIGATTIVCLFAAREAPSVKIDMPQQTQTVGGQAALYCTALGIPEPQVEWVRVDGVPLSARHKVEAPGYVV